VLAGQAGDDAAAGGALDKAALQQVGLVDVLVNHLSIALEDRFIERFGEVVERTCVLRPSNQFSGRIDPARLFAYPPRPPLQRLGPPEPLERHPRRLAAFGGGLGHPGADAGGPGHGPQLGDPALGDDGGPQEGAGYKPVPEGGVLGEKLPPN